jgi:RNA ligase (TIGR02306 family)
VSTHKVEVIRIADIERHPNADRLGIVRVYGFTAIVALGEYKPGDLAVYIEPDYVVPDTEQFAFLQGKTRIRAKKLRGVWSQGLLIKAPTGAKEGDCVMQQLGITRYEPPMKGQRTALHGKGGRTGTSTAEKPHATLAGIGVYDLENWRRHGVHLVPGEPVVITEKIHGCNARYAWRDGRMWCGSRTQWRKSGEQTWWHKFKTRLQRWWRKSNRPNQDIDMGNVWWRVLKTHPWIEAWCKANPDCVLYGEVFGDVQDLKYGAGENELFFRAFDVLRGGQWVDAIEFLTMLPAEHRVPVLHCGDYEPAMLEELSRGDSKLAKQMSEGIVIRPVRERWDGRVGRIALKLVSDRYLERAA